MYSLISLRGRERNYLIRREYRRMMQIDSLQFQHHYFNIQNDSVQHWKFVCNALQITTVFIGADELSLIHINDYILVACNIGSTKLYHPVSSITSVPYYSSFRLSDRVIDQKWAVYFESGVNEVPTSIADTNIDGAPTLTELPRVVFKGKRLERQYLVS